MAYTPTDTAETDAVAAAAFTALHATPLLAGTYRHPAVQMAYSRAFDAWRGATGRRGAAWFDNTAWILAARRGGFDLNIAAAQNRVSA